MVQVSSSRDFSPAVDNRKCGSISEYIIGYGDVGTRDVFTTSSPGLTGSQSVNSWRTSPSEQFGLSNPVLSGAVIYDIIRHGGDIDVADGSSGVLFETTDWGSTPYDNGHEFDTSSYIDKKPMGSRNFQSFGNLEAHWLTFDSFLLSGGSRYTLHFHGTAPWWVPVGSSADPELHFPTRSERIQDGTRAVYACSPVRPLVKSAENLIMLYTEGLMANVVGREIKRHGVHLKTISGEFLAYTFGLMPNVGWGKGLLKSAKKSYTILKQLIRDSDKPIRRTFVLRDETENIIQAEGAVSSASLNWKKDGGNTDIGEFLDFSHARYIITETRNRLCKFSGEFMYHLEVPKGMFSEFERRSQEINKILGTTVDADTLWAVMPWTWLFGWWGNVGTILSNASLRSQYGLVMRYGYVQHFYSSRRTCTITGIATKSGETLPALVTSDIEITRKCRTRANPFGFGVSNDGLDDHQWAILGALALSSGPNMLRTAE